jgi:hypothetical protein
MTEDLSSNNIQIIDKTGSKVSSLPQSGKFVILRLNM